MGNVSTPIANIAVAYDDPITNITSILIFNQVLYIKEMQHNLIAPFQLRMSVIMINEAPIMTLRNEFGVFHTIIPDDAKELTQNNYLPKAHKAGSVIQTCRTVLTQSKQRRISYSGIKTNVSLS
jgi:hypothetical protein